MSSGKFITAAELAALAGVSSRSIRKAIAAGIWRGSPLVVQVVKGRGGARGSQYVIAADSIPLDLQARHQASKRARQLALPLGKPPTKLVTFRLGLVAPIAALAPGAQRAAAIRDLLARKLVQPNGNAVNRTAIYKWLDQYEESGIAGLMRRPNNQNGIRKTFVTREWDAAVPFDDATKTAVGEALTLHVRGLYKAGQPISKVQFLAQLWLRQQTEKLGFLPNDPSVFNLSRPFLDRAGRHYAKVARHRQDRKASEDSRFRVQRDASGLVPMEVVVGDVHYMNAPLTLPGGRVVYPRMISFVDVATLRIFSVVVISENGGVVRVVDMIDAYKAMVTNASWGIPQTLYLDNGKENVFAPFMQDAARLAWPASDGTLKRTLIKAQAYNAQAKAHVEARFAKVENHYLKHMQGWAGDDRHNPNVPQLGRRHAPFDKGTDAYFAEFYDWEHVDNTFPVKDGHLAGDSPMQRFGKFVAGEIDGTRWQAVVASEAGFNMAFSERQKVKLTRQQFKLGNRSWSSDALKKHHRDYVFIYRPRYHKFNALVVEDLEGAPLGIATPNEVLDYLDPKGIVNSLAARKLFYEGLQELDRTAPTIDAAALLIEHARNQLPVRPNPPQGVVNASIHVDTRLAFRPRPATAEDDEEAQRAKRMADYEAALAAGQATLRKLRGQG